MTTDKILEKYPKRLTPEVAKLVDDQVISATNAVMLARVPIDMQNELIPFAKILNAEAFKRVICLKLGGDWSGDLTDTIVKLLSTYPACRPRL